MLLVWQLFIRVIPEVKMKLYIEIATKFDDGKTSPIIYICKE